MNIRNIAVVALSNRDYPSFTEKLREAAHWVAVAAKQGAQLVVLPEALNLYKGDGPGNPEAMSVAEAALGDWEKETEVLRQAARKNQVALTIPVYTREKQGLTNSFFLVSKRGTTLGRYQKLRPTPGELREGVRPGKMSLIEWEGLKVGGAICFDTCFPEVFEMQFRAGARLFLIPSLWPGGIELNSWALRYSTPMALAYPAWSRIIDMTGKDLVAGGYRHETLRFGYGVPVYVASINFERAALFDADEMVSRLLHEQNPGVQVTFDQDNCLYFIESRNPKLRIRDVMRRHRLVSTQEYFGEYRRVMERRGDFDA
ncbi:MAG: carbon-nitrogen hydrolase family protein [Verrucomicrobia bacterium]|nr:carbon-nitrogen hydrolase family protein [Verrucomicrobiota bacterium]